MDFQTISSVTQKVIPGALLLGLVGDWFRLRMNRRSDEKKHIARAISEILQIRYIVLNLPDFPKLMPKLIPRELKSEIPDGFWESFDFSPLVLQLLPPNDKTAQRYQLAVDEIAGHRPVLAYQLRGKESYLDLRQIVSNYFSQTGNSPATANKLTRTLDREVVCGLEDTLKLLAKAHSVSMRVQVAFACRRKRTRIEDVISVDVKKVFREWARQVAAQTQAHTVATAAQTN